MIVNHSKTKFFVLNGGNDDARPLEVNGLTVEAQSGYQPLEVMVHSIQRKFFRNMWRESSTHDDDLLTFVMN
ncbi:hypothetical protein E2C01_061867 [Portunus trituberculatus]|uniref:Uncharacterized protein n=1 Tax=Portunus trituberculatus TaxID=210409 RepID=A0A5B7HFK9_PORTR|nr:hypothetical protein [Portunus trituberculatus]